MVGKSGKKSHEGFRQLLRMLYACHPLGIIPRVPACRLPWRGYRAREVVHRVEGKRDEESHEPFDVGGGHLQGYWWSFA